ncbi:MAG: tyrosine-type recombinase/integrase, partial [Deltaproteobacteria bacterium]|nr:tyrosine-type recombinase/integrase [Deltaproteobacteria bacterium]
HLLEKGYDIRTIRELLGHKFVHTTIIYTHVASKNILGVRSPLDKCFYLPRFFPHRGYERPSNPAPASSVR